MFTSWYKAGRRTAFSMIFSNISTLPRRALRRIDRFGWRAPGSDAARERADAENGAERAPRFPQGALLVSIACIFALCGVFLWVYLTSPSDGTRVDPGESAWQRNGVKVLPLAPQPQGPRAGDIVVAIDGRSMESWSSSLFHPSATPPHLAFGQRVVYTVLRGNRRLDVPVRLGAYPLGAMLGKSWGMLIFVGVFELVGLFVYVRRPAEAAARVLFFSASCLLGASAWLFGLQVINLTGGASFWLYSITVLGIYLLFWSSLLHFSLAFPHPSALTRARPWLVPLVYVLPFVVYPVYLGVTRALAPSTLAWLGLWEPGEVTIGVIYVALAVITMTWTYRTYTDLATQRKIRWVVFASAISGGGAAILWIIPWDVFGHPIISTNLLGLLLLPFPAALAIAILRYRLFDIDVIINRALVYGTLTATLAIIYAVCVIGLQALIQPVIGGVAGQTSPLAIIGSTLASGALFQPLRTRIQAFIDRRFYRGKYDAVRTLEAFAGTLHSELDLAQLSQRLVAIVEETTHPTLVSLWLRTPEAPVEPQGFQLWERAARLSIPVPSGVNGANAPVPEARSGSGDGDREPDVATVEDVGTGTVPAMEIASDATG